MNARARSVALLVLAVLGAVGSHFLAADTWAELADPKGFGGLIVAAVSAAGGWMSRNWNEASRVDNDPHRSL